MRSCTTMARATAGLLAVAALFAAAGCGSDADPATEATAPGAAATVPEPSATELPAPDTSTPADTTGRTDATNAAVARIVSLSPTHTEILFAIGAGDQVVAIDDQSNYPPEALELPHDLSGFEPSVEAIAGYDPDLVVLGGDTTGLGAQLDEVGIDWWDGPAGRTLDDTYAQIEQLGAITGHPAEAAELVLQMQTDVERIIAETPVPETPLSIYHELDSTFYSVDSSTYLGELYSLFGLRNIADEAEGNSGGYPQLNAEFLVSTDPDLIFLADTICCGESLETVAARPGWDAIAAVRNGNVFEMDDDIASRWGPRVVDYLESVSAAIQQAVVPA